MARVSTISLKRGTSHGLWQYKTSGTHDRVILDGMRQILDRTCRLLGYDDPDRSTIYLFSFSSEPFEGYQACARKTREDPAGGCRYRVVQSRIGDFEARGLLPAPIRTSYLGTWPAWIYYRLEASVVGGITS